MNKEDFRQWAVLELMGHRRLAGFVTSEELAGKSFLRLDIHNTLGDSVVTQYYSPDAVYCITPTTEELAKRVSDRFKPEPIHRFELPALPERDNDYDQSL